MQHTMARFPPFAKVLVFNAAWTSLFWTICRLRRYAFAAQNMNRFKKSLWSNEDECEYGASLAMDVLFHPDVGSLIHAHVDVETLMALRATCRMAPHAIAFSPMHARRERQKYQGNPYKERTALRRLAAEGDIHMFQYMLLEPNPFCWTASVLGKAAQHGHYPILEWAQHAWPPLERGWEGHSFTGVECLYAAKGKRMDVVEWLMDHGYELPRMFVDFMAADGNLRALKWARARIAPKWTSRTFVRAAIKGHLHVMKWLRAQDPPCPFDPEMTVKAIIHNLEIRSKRLHFTGKGKEKIKLKLEALNWFKDNGAQSLRHRIDHEIAKHA